MKNFLYSIGLLLILGCASGPYPRNQITPQGGYSEQGDINNLNAQGDLYQGDNPVIINNYGNPNEDIYAKPILTAIASVTLHAKSSEEIDTLFIISGCYLAFTKGNDPLLILSSRESVAKKSGVEEVTYSAKLQMDDNDRSVGKPVRSLLEAEYIEAWCHQLPDTSITSGSATVTINSEVRFNFDIPAQAVDEKSVFIRDLAPALNIMRNLPALRLQPTGKAGG